MVQAMGIPCVNSTLLHTNFSQLDRIVATDKAFHRLELREFNSLTK